MKKLLAILLSALFWGAFGFLLLIFHPIQVVTRVVWNNNVRRKSVNVLNYLLIKIMWLLGNRVTMTSLDNLPINRPIIIISNHQSTFDIAPIVRMFRKHDAKFISKIELGKGIPSISYNLKHGGSALIDRKNKSQSIKEIITLGRRIANDNTAVCIFPEGTRSKTGELKKFQTAGVATLLRMAPKALIVPFVIDGNYKIIEKGYFPLDIGLRLNYSMLDPIEPEGKDVEDIVRMAEEAIKQHIADR